MELLPSYLSEPVHGVGPPVVWGCVTLAPTEEELEEVLSMVLDTSPEESIVRLNGTACDIFWYCSPSATTTPALVSSEVESMIGRLGIVIVPETFDSVIIVMIVCCSLITYWESSALARPVTTLSPTSYIPTVLSRTITNSKSLPKSRGMTVIFLLDCCSSFRQWPLKALVLLVGSTFSPLLSSWFIEGHRTVEGWYNTSYCRKNL
jgi:hypothetical protein